MKNNPNFPKIFASALISISTITASADIRFKCGNHDPADIARSVEEAQELAKTKSCKNWDVISSTGELTDQQRRRWLANVEGGCPNRIAADPLIGVWKLDASKSALSPGVGRNNVVVYEPTSGGQLHVVVDGTDPNGKPIHSEWTGRFDGKHYAVKGNPIADTLSYKRIDDRTIDFAATKDGKITTTGRIVLAVDEKSRTVTSTAVTPAGKKVKNVTIYSRQ